MADVKNNLRATAYPQATDDTAAGYSQGSYWAFNGTVFFCRSATAGAADWTRVGPGDDRGWQSNAYAWPDNFGASTLATPTDISRDVLAFFPFNITRPIAGAAIHLSALGAAGATAAPRLSIGLFNHDRTTGRFGSRRALLGVLDLSSGATGLRGVTFASLDVLGLYWVGVHIRLNLGAGGTAPTFRQMTQGNGRHVTRGDGTDLTLIGVPYPCFYSNDPYPTNDSIATTTATNAVPVPIVPMPALRAA